VRIKVITKDHGEYTSDDLSFTSYVDALDIAAIASKGQTDSLSFNYKGGRVFFTPELLKTSVVIVVKD